MAARKKSLIASLIKEIVGVKSSPNSQENDERKKQLIQETIKETANSAATGENAGDDAAMMKILNMLETQLNVKTSALEEEASKRKDAELEVQKLQQQLMKLGIDQKKDDSEMTLNTIKQLVEALSTEDSDSAKGKSQQKPFKDCRKQNFQQGFRGNRGKGFNRPNSREANNDKVGNKPNFSGNLNTPDDSKVNKCQNKTFDEQNLSQFSQNKNFNPVKNDPLLTNFNQYPPQFNQPNNFNQNQRPHNNFNPINAPPPLLQANPLLLPNQNNLVHRNDFNQLGRNVGFNIQRDQFPTFPNQGGNQFPTFPNQGGNQFPTFPNQGGNQFSTFPNQGGNQFPTFPNQDGNQHQQFRNARGRGGFNRGRGNFRGNVRGEANTRKQFGENISEASRDKIQEDGFVVVSKSEIGKNFNKHNTGSNQVAGGHLQNKQKTNFKKKTNRNRPVKEGKEEKEKDIEFDAELVMQGMKDVFSIMFGTPSSEPAKPEPPQPPKPKNDEPQQPKKPKPPKPKNDKPQSAVDSGPNQQTGAIKKNVPGKPNKKKGDQETGSNSNPIRLFDGSGFPSEEEATSKNINLSLEVKDVIMIAKHKGNSVTEQPKTLRDMTNFKKKYPNAKAIVVRDEH